MHNENGFLFHRDFVTTKKRMFAGCINCRNICKYFSFVCQHQHQNRIKDSDSLTPVALQFVLFLFIFSHFLLFAQPAKLTIYSTNMCNKMHRRFPHFPAHFHRPFNEVRWSIFHSLTSPALHDKLHLRFFTWTLI